MDQKSHNKKKDDPLGGAKKTVPPASYFASIVDFIPDALISTDNQYRVTGWNAAAERTYGWKAEEVTGKPVSNFFQTSYQNTDRNEVIAIARKTGTWSGEVTQLRKDGTRIPIWSSVSIVKDEQGRPIGFIGVNHDISERKRTEEALRLSEQKFSILFEKAAFAASLSRLPDGVIANVNEAFERTFGYTKQEAIGKTSLELGINPDSEGRERALAALKEQGSARNLELALHTKSGELRIFSVNIDLVNIGDQKYILNTTLDITERRRAEIRITQLARLYATLSQVNQTIVRVKDHNELYQTICDVAVQYGGFSLAWVGLLDEGSGEIRPAKANGLDVTQWPFPIVNIHQGQLRSGLIATAIRTFRVVTSEDIQTDQRTQSLHDQFQKFDYHSSAFVPFRLRGRTIGVLGLTSSEADLFKVEGEVRLLEEMSLDISFALETMETERIKRQWADAFEHCAHGISIGLPDANQILTCNPAFANLQGRAIEEISSMPILSMYAPQDHEHVKQSIAEADRVGSVRYEAHMIRKDGSVYPVQMDVVSVRDENGNLLYRVATQQDITERKRAEAEIQRHTEQLVIVNEIGRALAQKLELEYIYRSMGEAVFRLLPDISSVFISLFDAQRHLITCAYANMDQELLDPAELPPIPLEPPGRGTQSEAIHTRRPLIVNDLRERLKQVKTKMDVGSNDGRISQSGLYLPMIAEERVIGVIQVQSYTLGRFSEADADLLGLAANTAAVVIENARLYRAIQQELDERKRAEETLRQSEDRYHDLVDHSHDLIGTHDLQGNILSINPAATKLVGIDQDALLKMNLRDILAPESRNLFDDYLAAIQRDGHASGLMLVQTSAGERRIWEYDNTLRTESVDRPIVRALARDISERKRAEEELRKSEERFRSLYENATIGMYRTTPDGHILLANPALVKMLGYASFDELIQRNLEKEGYEPGYERSLFHQQIERDGAVIGLESAWTRKDGTNIFVRESAKAIKNTEGNVLYYEGTVEDITERKRAEQALRESETRFRSMIENSSDEISILDASGTLMYESPSSNPTLGYRPGEFLGKSLFQLMHPDDLARVQSQFAQLLRDPNLHPRDQFRLLHNNGAWRWVEAVGTNLLDEPSVRGIVINYHDITERVQAQEKIQHQLQRLNALRMIDLVISNTFDMQLSLTAVLKEAVSQLDISAAAVLLYNQPALTLKYAAGNGFRSSAIQQIRLRIGEGLAGRAALERRTIHIPNLARTGNNFARAELLANEAFISYYGVPLIAKGELKGVLEIFHRTKLDPDQEWLDFLETLGGQAAIAIDNAQLFEGMQQSNLELIAAYDATIAGWSHAMDLRDKETEGHTQRVTELTVRLAERMGISQQEIAHIRRGALLHDIGKLGVPDHILLKPSQLTEEEWVIMRQHPTYAFNMLTPITYLRPSLDIPYCHHEKWDGSGYPRKLKGEQIPLAARLFAVVDVWDALRSDRPYRASWSVEQTRQYILEQSGKHFEPRVVRQFLDMLNNGDFAFG